MCQWSISIFETSCGYTALNLPEWREMTEQTDWRAKQPLQVVCVSEDLKCWGAWDSTCGHKAKDITPLIAWRRKAWKVETFYNFPSKDQKGPKLMRWPLELFQRQRWGNFWEMGCSADGLFQVHRHHLELNWSVLNKRSAGGWLCTLTAWAFLLAAVEQTHIFLTHLLVKTAVPHHLKSDNKSK